MMDFCCGNEREKSVDELHLSTSRVIHCSDRGKNALFQYPPNVVCNTKYTWINFLPKTLMEQFSFHMNRYFLFIACLQLFSTITPVSPLSTWLPLLFVLAVSAVKELVDDLRRAKLDKEVRKKQ